MRVSNVFQMNNWEISKFLIIISVIQVSILGLIALDYFGLGVPILRQIVGFIYLAFIPGTLILRILKLKDLSNIESILYSVGLSTAVLMFTGFFMNIFYPIFGMDKPIMLIPIIITISILTIFLGILSYIKDEKSVNTNFVETKNFISLKFMSLCIVPLLAIVGTYLMNFYQNNLILMLLIVLIAIILLLVAYDKLPKELYPFTIFIISISILYHTSLISNYLWGWDIQKEFFIANQVINNGYWDFNIPGNINAMLSITMLAPIYSIILNMDVTWLFKIIYPILFSLVPLGSYKVFQSQTSEKIAFLSSSFFIIFYVFFTEMLQLARQEIAELFLVLLILLIIDKDKSMGKSFLLIIFTFSLVVSHYGLSYIYMLLLISVFIILTLLEKIKMPKLFARFKSNDSLTNLNNTKVQMGAVLLFIVFTVGWYLYVSNGYTLDTIIKIGNQITGSIYVDFMNSDSAQGLNVIQEDAATPLHTIWKLLQLLSQFLVIIGFFSIISKITKFKFKKEYLIFSFMAIVLLIAGIVVPFFASSLNTSRLYQVTLIFLAPFCVIGTISILKLLSKLLNTNWSNKNILKTFSIFLVILLFFNTGFIFEVANDSPTSFSLSKNFDYPLFNNKDILGSEWMKYNINDSNRIYADDYRTPILHAFNNTNIYVFNGNNLKNGSYIYLGTFNLLNNEIYWNSTYLSDETILNEDEIYNNGGSKIFRYYN